LETVTVILNCTSHFATKWTSRALAGLMGGMTAVILVAITSRYVIKASVPWAEELARYLMVWAAFLGGSLGLKRGVHVGITFVVRKIPPHISRWVSLFTGLSLLFFFLVVIVEGCCFTMFVSRQLSPALRVSMAWVYSALPTGGILFALYVIQFIVADMKALTEQRKTAGG
jgi:TRAP-type C4-dicarboxylate transport system permease small subunit